MNIDLRQETSDLLQEYGHKIILQRTSRKIHCRCWDHNTNEAQPRCPYCSGTGWVNRMESHYTRKDPGTSPVSWADRNKDTALGKQLQDANIYFFMHNAHPRVGDIMYEVGWDELGRPTHVIHTQEINYVFPYRADNGRIEYFEASCDNKVMDKSFHTFHIRRIGQLTNYEPVGKDQG